MEWYLKGKHIAIYLSTVIHIRWRIDELVNITSKLKESQHTDRKVNHGISPNCFNIEKDITKIATDIIGIESHITCTNMCGVLVNIYYAVICSLVAFYVPSIFMLVCNLKIF
jgi:hypothetical protein